MVQPTDTETLSAIRQGQTSALEGIFRAYYPGLCRHAASLLRDTDEAEEAVQTVFLNFWEKRLDLEITQSLKAYLYRAVYNHCLNRLKHYGVRETHRQYTLNGQKDGYDAVDEAIEGHELASQIEQAVARLPEQCQIMFRLSRFEQLSYQEIADHLGLSIKTVENQIGKALKIMRRELAEYLPVLALMMMCYFCEAILYVGQHPVPLWP